MDRKSFFKNTLLTIGAAIVPNAILRANKVHNPVPSIGLEKDKADGFMVWEVDGEKFYWSEWTAEDYYKHVEGMNFSDKGIPYTKNKDGSVTLYCYVGKRKSPKELCNP